MNEVFELIEKIEKEKNSISKRIKKLYLADNLKPIDFTYKDKLGFVKYEDGVFVRNIASDLQIELGVSCLHVLVTKDADIEPHIHRFQNQIIYIRKGRIYDYENNITYTKEQEKPITFTKNNKHSLKFFFGSEYLMVFLPNLKGDLA